MLQLCIVRVEAMSILHKMQKDGSGNVKSQDQIDTALNLALGGKRATENVEWRGGRTKCAGRALRHSPDLGRLHRCRPKKGPWSHK